MKHLTEEQWKALELEKRQQREIKFNKKRELEKKKLEKQAILEKKKREIEEIFDIPNFDSLTHSEKLSYSVKYSRLKDPTIQERISKAVSKNHKEGKYIKAKEALQQHNNELKGKKRSEEDCIKIKRAIKNRRYVCNEESRKKRSQRTQRRRWYNNSVKNIYIDKDTLIPKGYKHGRIKT